MENAGRGIADRAARFLEWLNKKRALVVCGTGNNGGDGFVAARHLHNRFFQTAVAVIGSRRNFTEDAAANYAILRKMGLPLLAVSTPNMKAFCAALRRADLVVDALFGTGLDREVTGIPAKVIEAVNGSGIPVLAVDIPSGLNGGTGEILGVSVKARETAALGAPKTGFFLNDGPRVTGKITVIDISIPRDLF
jgi:NAD(P)H-hydrate epimerase